MNLDRQAGTNPLEECRHSLEHKLLTAFDIDFHQGGSSGEIREQRVARIARHVDALALPQVASGNERAGAKIVLLAIQPECEGALPVGERSGDDFDPGRQAIQHDVALEARGDARRRFDGNESWHALTGSEQRVVTNVRTDVDEDRRPHLVEQPGETPRLFRLVATAVIQAATAIVLRTDQDPQRAHRYRDLGVADERTVQVKEELGNDRRSASCEPSDGGPDRAGESLRPRPLAHAPRAHVSDGCYAERIGSHVDELLQETG